MLLPILVAFSLGQMQPVYLTKKGQPNYELGAAATQPISCRLTDGAAFYTAGGGSGLTDAQLRATPVPISGTFWPTTAAAPSSCRMSDGAAFIDPRSIRALTTTDQITAAMQSVAKGASAAAGITSTASGANHQALDVAIYDGAGNLKDPTQVRALTSSDVVTIVQATAANLFMSAVQSGTWTVRAVGNAGAAFDAANNAAAPANVLVTGAETIATSSNPTASTTGNVRRILASTEGVQYVQEGGPNKWSCFLQAITATTICQAAPAAGLKLYVTSAHFSNQAATVQTLDIVYGTTAGCAAGTGGLTHKWQMGTNATTTSPQSIDANFDTPLVPGAANAICVRPSVATAFGATLTGYTAP